MATTTQIPEALGTQPAHAAGSRRRWRRRLVATARHATAIVIAVIFLVPLFWMLSGSLKSNADIFRFPPSLWPAHPEWSNYSKALSYIPFWHYLANSLIVSAATVGGTLFSAVLAAYAFAVMRWRGREAMFGLSLALIMLPFPVVMIPLYIIFRHLGWIGSLLPLTVPPWAAQFVTPYFSSALAIFLLRQFFRGLPRSLIEAAQLDGASNWSVLRRVVIPLSRGPIATVVILSFLTSWTAFIGPLIFINNQSDFTLSLGLQQYQSTHFTAYNYLMAASLVFMIPTLIIFVVAQRHLIRGIAFSGLKS
jgi:multiple sugar transport system permease protein